MDHFLPDTTAFLKDVLFRVFREVHLGFIKLRKCKWKNTEFTEEDGKTPRGCPDTATARQRRHSSHGFQSGCNQID
jgi:hypothetical protein